MKRKFKYTVRYWRSEPRNKSGRRYYRIESPAFNRYETAAAGMRATITSLGYEGFQIDNYFIESFISVDTDITENDIIPY